MPSQQSQQAHAAHDQDVERHHERPSHRIRTAVAQFNYDLEDELHFPSLVQKLVLIKGFCDFMMAFSLMFFPWLLYSGPFMEVLSDLTTLPTTSGMSNASSAFELATLMMGSAFSAITTAESQSKGALKTVGKS
ncbi:hypothetical protein CVT24_002295 [Panaeolus cyanescens]|uniref:Uncharacterized protein n=1 Tax=Panaeolus cyanescens TaxID=181874 RepID=A0A409YIL6_9AGAR|nr:hypothetical protein CVT24_002295 [Panaeolus cyanescens]